MDRLSYALAERRDERVYTRGIVWRRNAEHERLVLQTKQKMAEAA